ncbi:Glycerol kinase [Pyrobaculum oguniense TE7]|uniref:Glycerol kinase n=1 Tax=Pyrobaculum oguniense (strain DSM 13380 / JCM 10595 / TE7) TaxID=698757 RepID=H6QB40_PYROT|nr:Glycerol kinase [Pyrobaculum oguniense TE7]
MYGVLDIGTTRIKFFVFDKELRRTYGESLENVIHNDGTQDPLYIERVVRHFLRVARERGVQKLGVATYRSSIIAWDSSGKPLSPIYTWLYNKIEDVYGVRFKILQYIPRLGILFRQFSPLFRFLKAYKAHDLGRCLKEGRCYLWTLDSYIAYLLTRRFISDATNATLTGLIHPSNFKPIPLVEDLLGVEIPRPEIVDNYGEFGDVDNLEFRVLIADQQAASIAEGAVEPDVVKATLGTGLFVDIPTGVYREKSGFVPLVLYKVGGRVGFGVEAYLAGAGRVLDLLVSWGLATYQEMSELEPAGGYVFTIPALAGFQYPPASWIRGSILGIRYRTERRDIMSSIVATLAFYVRYVIDSAGVEPRIVRVNGGGSRLNSFVRCLATLLKARVERAEDSEGTARGVVYLLAYGDGAVEWGKPLGTFLSLGGGYKYCDHYQMWLQKMRYLKNLKPFFQGA